MPNPKNYLIISADTHAGADLLDYKPYLESKWHDAFDEWAAAYSSPWDDLVHDTAERNWNSEVRRELMEAEGIVGEVIFPNTIPPFFPTIANIVPLPRKGHDFEQRMAGIRAHNRWLVDFCNELPDQRRGMLQIFPHDIESAVAEIEWAAEHDVIGGVLIPAIPPNHRDAEPLYTDFYDPIWAACQEAGLTVGTHSGSGEPEYPDHPASAAVMLYEFGLFTNRTLSHLLIGGIFEKFPELIFTMTEQGVKWVLETIGRLETQFSAVQDRPWLEMFVKEAFDKLSLRPKEYFERNCVVGASILRPGEVDAALSLGADNIMWGSDFPHREATSPYSVESLRVAVGDVEEADLRKMLGETAARTYGFDLEKLQVIADRVGPSPETIATPLPIDEFPTDNEWFLPAMQELAR